MIRALRIGFALVMLAAVGLVLGLVYGWIVAPVEYRDVDPADLAQEYRDDYVRLVAAAYLLNQDLAFARQRLAALGYDADDVAAITEAAIRRRDPLAPALAALSYGVGANRPDFAAWLPTPTPTATLSPTASPSPTPTPSPTPRPSPTTTPLPTATPSPSPTATPLPTMTPQPTATHPPPTPTPTPLPPSPIPMPPHGHPGRGCRLRGDRRPHALRAGERRL
ncbi:MAG: hypothetical protein Q9O62_11025 [Ardenticatenia bacterium]|nr:hypothetical protein [Ardenticatenia bacterium]